jgi:hypothetical protein
MVVALALRTTHEAIGSADLVCLCTESPTNRPLTRLSQLFKVPEWLPTLVHGEDALRPMQQFRLPPWGVDVVGHGLLPGR